MIDQSPIPSEVNPWRRNIAWNSQKQNCILFYRFVLAWMMTQLLKYFAKEISYDIFGKWR